MDTKHLLLLGLCLLPFFWRLLPGKRRSAVEEKLTKVIDGVVRPKESQLRFKEFQMIVKNATPEELAARAELVLKNYGTPLKTPASPISQDVLSRLPDILLRFFEHNQYLAFDEFVHWLDRNALRNCVIEGTDYLVIGVDDMEEEYYLYSHEQGTVVCAESEEDGALEVTEDAAESIEDYVVSFYVLSDLRQEEKKKGTALF